jgi:hypothetical protein
MANSHITAVPCRANSHMPFCVPAKSSLKFLTVAGRSRTAHCLRVYFQADYEYGDRTLLFYMSLTVHLGIILVNNQLDALFQCTVKPV